MTRRSLAAAWAGLWLALILVPLAARAEALRYGQGLLWRVDKPGVAPSHVFGTIHSIDLRVVTLPPPVAKAFGAARSLCVELVLDEAADRRLVQAAVLPPDRTLDGVIGPAMFRQVVAAGARYGLTPQALQHLKPWVLLSILSFPPADFARMSAGEPVLDDWLQKDAAARRVPVYGLESADEQIAVLDTMPEQEQIALLAGTLAENAEIDRMFATILGYYLAGDVAAIQDALIRQMAENDPALTRSLEQHLVIDRNRRMATRLAERLVEGDVFVAVGALHLPGEHGILHLLEEQGYRVSRVY